MNEMIDDQMIEILSYLYEDFSLSENDQKIVISSYWYEDYALFERFSNRFDEWWCLSIQMCHVENFFRMWVIDHDRRLQMTDLNLE